MSALAHEPSKPESSTPATGISKINPAGTRGFEFVEYTAEDTAALGRLFEQLGFQAVARHRSKAVTLYRQSGINFIVNQEPGSFAQAFARAHGPSACAMAFRVADAAQAFERAIGLGAEPFEGRVGPMELNIPAIEGIGGSLIYLVDRFAAPSIYDIDFVPVEGADSDPEGVGLSLVDHLTHNVRRGQMDHWAGFYERLFNFREIRYFDIEGKLTGLKSRAMTSPCGLIRIPINESCDDKSQIEEYLAAYKGEGIQHIALASEDEEYLAAYKGEGIQHIALASEDIYGTVEALIARGVPMMDPPPDAYYAGIDERLPGHGEDLARLEELGILIDGAPGGGLLLQIFTKTVIGPIFFEIIQRNDQVERGVLDAPENDGGKRA
jgi:4-hydroxyphenylpyruvate dioxygenase